MGTPLLCQVFDHKPFDTIDVLVGDVSDQKSIQIHPGETVRMCSNFHGSSDKSCQDNLPRNKN